MSKRVYMGHVVAIGGHRISREAPGFQPNVSRAQIDATVLEDKSETYELGLSKIDVAINGAFTSNEAERRFLTRLAQATKFSSPILAQMDPGNGAAGDSMIMMDACVPTVKETNTRGQIRTFDLTLTQNGDRLLIGSLIFTSLGGAGVTAAVAGPTVTFTGGLAAGQEAKIFVEVLNYPVPIGTGLALTGNIESSLIGDFTDAVTRQALTAMDENPNCLIYTLDGDVTPVTDAAWRVHFTGLTGTGLPQVWVRVAMVIADKPGL